MTRTRLCIAAALAFALACTSNPAPGGDPATPASATRRTDVITAHELADPSVAAGDALEAVRRSLPWTISLACAPHRSRRFATSAQLTPLSGSARVPAAAP